jgi:hypothetical protein
MKECVQDFGRGEKDEFQRRAIREDLGPQITEPMHADVERKNSEFFICVNLRHLRAIPDAVAGGRAVFLCGQLFSERKAFARR